MIWILGILSWSEPKRDLGGFKNNETHCSCLASVPALETQAFFEEDNNKEKQREKKGC